MWYEKVDRKKLEDASALEVRKLTVDGDLVMAEVEGRGGTYCPSIDFFLEGGLLLLRRGEDARPVPAPPLPSPGAEEEGVAGKKAEGGG